MRRRFPVPVWAACWAAVLWLACSLALAEPVSSVKVATSRGAFDLRLFAPEHDASRDPAPPSGKPAVLFVSGEGGWRRFDDRVAGQLAELGCWVGGVDATSYFWDAQDDRQALAADFHAFAAALATAAGGRAASPIVLAGFSFGADLAPWLAGAGGWAERPMGLLMIGPDEIGSLQFRLTEILGFQPKEHVFSVAAALRDAAGVPVVLIHGEEDADSAARSLHGRASDPRKLITIPGADHHFSGHETELRSALCDAIAWIVERSKRD